MERLQGGEQPVGHVGHLARVRDGDTVAPRHTFHSVALVAIEFGKLAANTARDEIGDDAVTQTGGGVIERRHFEILQEMQKHGGAGDDDLGAARSDARDFASGVEVSRTKIMIELADLGGGSAQAVGLIDFGAGDAVDGADDSGGSSRCRDHALAALVTDAAERGAELFGDVLAHAMELDGCGRITFQKDFGQANSAERLGHGLAHSARFAEDNLGATAADVNDQDILVRMRPAALHAKMDEPGLFLAGDNLYRRGNGFRCAREELTLVSCVANGTGGDGSNPDDLQLAILLRHSGENAAHQGHGIGADAAGAKNALAQARNLAVGREDFDGRTRGDLGSLHAERVAANVDRGVSGHIHVIINAALPPVCNF